MVSLKTWNIVLCGLFAALMAIGANVSPFLTIGGVPITLQLMFAILAGGILGSRTGAVAMLTYIFIGLVGAPVFAQFKGGPVQVLSPTFGFIISFVFVAYVTGKLIADQQIAKKKHYVGAGILSILLNYIIGTNMMFLAFKFWADAPDGFHYGIAWSWMLVYLPLDIVVTSLSLMVLPKLRKALSRRHIRTIGG
ncbi:MAG: biotin transporter BioY [Bacillus sp. (in: firmicutes)]|uniref:biotin transporter BioY n=1 Tax=Bacillus marasmi TaxID=1926279 RepID=UPI0011C95526|nr:biotin transporter BioY [Bacillus marasmi]